MARPYRKRICAQGQSSGAWLNKFVCDALERLSENTEINSIMDVGCGTGKQAGLLKEKYQNIKFKGLDFSEATYKFLQNSKIFDEVFLGCSNKLPLDDNCIDLALSMENLEHLYKENVYNAMEELKRISKCILITTPNATGVIDLKWLNDEICQAVNDNIEMSEFEYNCLASAVHKSTIFPKSLLNCGFKQITNVFYNHSVFYGISDEIDLTKLEYMGIKETELLDTTNYNNKYLDLLVKSRTLLDKIKAHKLYNVR